MPRSHSHSPSKKGAIYHRTSVTGNVHHSRLVFDNDIMYNTVPTNLYINTSLTFHQWRTHTKIQTHCRIITRKNNKPPPSRSRFPLSTTSRLHHVITDGLNADPIRLFHLVNLTPFYKSKTGFPFAERL